MLFRNNYNCGVHLISALLCGRPVVILGDPQNEQYVLDVCECIKWKQ